MARKISLFVAIAAAGIVFAGIWMKSRPVQVKKVGMSEILSEAREGGYKIILTDDLYVLLKEKRDLLVIDTRQEWEYDAGHIEGAINLPVEPSFWGRFVIKKKMEKLLGSDKERTVVFY